MRAATVQQLGHPAAGVIGWMGGNDVLSGVAVNEDSAMTYSAAWAATRLLAGTGAGLPLNVYERKGEGGKEIATGLPIYDLLHNAPNENMSSVMWRAQSIGFQVNRGNCFSEIDRDGNGEVQGLYPIHPTRVQFKWTEDRRPEYWVHVDGGRTAIIIAGDNMLHVPSMMSDDGINGKGVVTVARESLGFGIATERHGAAYFGNGGKPSVVVTHPRLMSPEARKNFRQEWQEIHGGVENNGKIALLQEGGDIKTLSFSPEDSQFLSTRQHNVEEVARWYGVPPHMIGHLLRSTYSNISVQGQEFVTYSLMPWLVLWEAECWRKLLSAEQRKRYFIKHNVDALLRADPLTRSQALAVQFTNGAINIDEWRSIEDRNPLPDGMGQKHFVPLNMTTIDKAGEEPEVPSVPVGRFPPPKPAEPEDTEEDENEPDEGAVKYIIGIRAAAQAAVDDVCGIMARKEIEATLTAAKHPEDCLQRLEKFYERHGERLVASAYHSVTTLLLAVADTREPRAVLQAAAESHVNESKRQLWQALECMPHELEAAVSACVAGWAGRKLDLFTGA